METVTLFERLGGLVGVETVVRSFYERVIGDPDGSLVPDLSPLERWVRSDGRTLTWLLSTPPVVRPTPPGLLLTRPDLVERHLRDALWAAGMASDLVEDVVAAVRLVTGATAA